MKYKILVTGGSGFIGTNLIQFDLDLNVLNIGNRSPRCPAYKKFWCNQDILDRWQEMILTIKNILIKIGSMVWRT